MIPSLFSGMIRICVLAIGVLISIASTSWADPLSLEDLAQALNERFKDREAILRPIPNNSLRVYVEVEGELYSVVHERSLLFPPRERLGPVTITTIETRSSRSGFSSPVVRGARARYSTTTPRFLRMRLRHPYLGMGALFIYGPNDDPPRDLDAVVQVLGYVIEMDGLPHPPLYVGDRESEVLYYAGVNHLPQSENREYFDDAEEAFAKGYEPSPLSFERLPRVSSLEAERRLGLRMAAELRYYYPLVVDPEQQARVERIGRRVLDNWPTTLKGYTYRFQLIESDILNAFACPGGSIFITTGLLKNLEDELELEAVLAHEITHVEKRHGFRMLRDAQAAAAVSVLVTLGAAASMQSDTGAAASAAGITGVLAGVASTLALLGYSREYEMEADLYATMYLLLAEKESRHLARVFRKFQYDRDRMGLRARETTLFSTHPNLEERIHIVENVQAHRYDPPLIFDGFDRQGERIASLVFEAGFVYERSRGTRILSLLAEIDAHAALGKEARLRELTIIEGRERTQLKNRERFAIQPLDTIGMTFEAEGRNVDAPTTIDRIEARFGSVREWIKRESAQ